MVFTHEESNLIYEGIYTWLACHTPAMSCKISLLKRYYKDVWKPIENKIELLLQKKVLTSEEKEFLKETLYNGPLYRVQVYSPKKRGHVYESKYYQAWSKSLVGLSEVSNYCGEVVLIKCNAKNGIDIFGILGFFMKYHYITRIDPFHNPFDLGKYEVEQEVEFPMLFDYITDVTIVNQQKILDWEEQKRDIPKENWMKSKL